MMSSRLVLLFLFLVPIYRVQSQFCKTEYSPSDTEDVQFQWASSNKTNNEVVFSDPVCYDNAENIAYKICSNNKWTPPSTPCLHYYEERQNFVKNQYQPCYFITNRQPWKQCILPKTNFCPRDTQHPISIWLPYKRMMEYGPFVSTILGTSYGKPIDGKIPISSYEDFTVEEFLTLRCLYLNTSSNLIYADYCEAKHHLNCTFQEELISDLCPKNCMFSLHSQQCVCKTKNKRCGDDLYNGYGAVENPNQKYLMQKLADRRGCYLGGSLKNLREAMNHQFWFYTDRDLDCSFCVQNRDNCRDTELVLTFFGGHGARLWLILYEPTCVFGLGDPSKIYCFTDAADELQKRLEIEEIFRGDNNRFIAYEVELEKRIGNYWCVAHAAPIDSKNIESNKILAYKEKHHEFAVAVSVKNNCSMENCVNSHNYALGYKNITKEIWQLADEYDFHVRLMKVINMNKLSIVLLFHITSLDSTSTGNYSNEYCQAHDAYKNLSQMLEKLSNNIQVLYYRSSEFCFTESYKGLTWPSIDGNTVATPYEFCVTKDQIPVYRMCTGDFMYGYAWSDLVGECYSESPCEHTQQLKEAAQNELCFEMLMNVANITKRAATNLQVVDIYYISEVLANASLYLNNTMNVVNGSLDIIDGVLDAELANLRDAQILLNLTDKIMLLNEDISSSLNIEDKLHVMVKDNLIFHIFDPFESDITGFVLYRNKSIKNIKLNQGFNNLEDTDSILLAIYIPNEIIDDLVSRNLTNTTISTTVFFNDKFVSSSENSSSGIVINVNIPPYKAFLPHDLPILFRHNSNDTTEYSCAFWDMGTNFQRKKGDWSEIGSNYSGKFKNESHLQMCYFSHLTHFGLLVLAKSEELSPLDTNTMNSLTAVGCFLSTIGIAGIFLTAYLFNKWRERTGTQILLHLSTATLLEIVFMYLNGTKLLNCRFAGITLHYVVLSKFAWMLVYAFCQYLRFVRVIGPMPKQLVLKSILFGWGFPVLPVLIVSLTDPISYMDDESLFCYPNGNSLYYGIYVPVSVILLINLIIFIKIFVYLSKNKLDGAKMVQAQQYKLHKRLFILLFFVLGIPWLFGLLANTISIQWIKSILLFIFSGTSALQGFIMFLFYVILNKETREFWRRSFKKYEVSESEKHTSSNGSSSLSFINFRRN